MLVCWSEGSRDKAGLLITCMLREGRQTHSEHSDFGSWWFTYQVKEGWEKEGVGGATGQAGALVHRVGRSVHENPGRSGAGQRTCASYLLRGTG